MENKLNLKDKYKIFAKRGLKKLKSENLKYSEGYNILIGYINKKGVITYFK